MAEPALQYRSLNAYSFPRALTHFFAWTFLSLGLFMFVQLFGLFSLSLFSLRWATAYFQFTENINLDLISCLVSPAVGLFFAVYWEARKPQPEALEHYRYWLQVG